MNTETQNVSFEALLDYLRRTRGFDFTAYKRSTLMRRVTKRMEMVGVEDYSDYLNYLEVHTEEFPQLFNTVLINVTSFFRDPPAWDMLVETVIPPILKNHKPNEPIRVWSAGCASGEEAYTLAIVLAEAIGLEAFRQRVKIYATDVDEIALAQARHAVYPAKDLEGLAPELRERYFELANGRFAFRGDLRRTVIFGRHDLLQDAPISRLDLLVCRNTLMYFNAEAQARILARFHFALNDTGYLFLGKAEMLLTHANLFSPIDLKHRLFSKVPKVELRDRMVVLTQAGDVTAAEQLGQYVRLREAAFDTASDAQVVIDRSGALVLANAKARSIFGLDTRDLGRPLQDLELSYRPVELRSLIEQAYAEGRPVLRTGIERLTPNGEAQRLDLQVVPLIDNGNQLLGMNIIFEDVTYFHQLQEEVQRSKQELETAYEELQSTNEELETTNEELQSTVEELQTTNEELQSTNEEMETMNEELQSSNEELQAINEELRRRTVELDQVNSFLQSILASVHMAVVVIDRALNVLLWNGRAEGMWGLRASEVLGRSLLDLDIGLPVSKLVEPMRAFLDGQTADHEVVVEAINRRGRTIQCRVTFNLHMGPEGEQRGVVLLMEEEPYGSTE